MSEEENPVVDEVVDHGPIDGDTTHVVPADDVRQLLLQLMQAVGYIHASLAHYVEELSSPNGDDKNVEDDSVCDP